MKPGYLISAYTSSGLLNGWDEKRETFFFEKLQEHPLVSGIEIPFLLSGEAYPAAWLKKMIPEHWNLAITSLPGVMALMEQHPQVGLASSNEEGRQEAIRLIAQIKTAIETLEQLLSRSLVHSLTLYSSPKNKTIPFLGHKEALLCSLQEIQEMEWGNIALNLEHCDTFIPTHSAEKGFLTLQDEIETVRSVGNIGIILNWGRSAIETHSTEGPSQHLEEVNKHQLLRGFVFSGCAATQDTRYGAWKDKHAPLQTSCPASLLTLQEVKKTVSKINREECSLGIKVSNRALPFEIEQSVYLNLELLEAVEKSFSTLSGT